MANPTVPMTTAQFAKAIDPAVNKYFTNRLKVVQPKIEKVLRVIDQTDYNQQEQTEFGLGSLPIVPQGQNYTTDAAVEGYTTTYTPDTHGTVIQITRQLVQYDKSAVGKTTKLAEMRAEAAANSIGQKAFGLFNHGFNTSYTSYGDGKPLFSTSHTSSAGGSAQSNASATGITLTDANYETALIALRQQLDDRGQPKMLIPDTLLVPLALEKEALILTKSSGRSGTADNDVNVYTMAEYTGGRSRVVSSRYLDSDLSGSNTAWFILDSNQHLVTWSWGVRPKIEGMNETEGYKNDTYYFKVMYEAAIGWSDWRGVWGSKGDGAAYSS